MFFFVTIDAIVNGVLQRLHIAYLRRKVFVELVAKEDQPHAEVVVGNRFSCITRLQLLRRERKINVAEVEIEIGII